MNPPKREPSRAFCESLAPNVLPTEGTMMPDLVLYDETKLYIIVTYPALNKDECLQHLLSTHIHDQFAWTREDISEYYEKCAAKYGSDVTLCLLNLFSEVRTRCNNFHLHYKGCPDDPEKNRAFHAVLLASNQQKPLIRQAIKTREDAYRTHQRVRPNENNPLNITELQVGSQHAYSMPLPFFYEFTNPISFGWQIGIVDKKGSLRRQDAHANA